MWYNIGGSRKPVFPPLFPRSDAATVQITVSSRRLPVSPMRTVLMRCSALSASDADTMLGRRSRHAARELFAGNNKAMFFWRGGSGVGWREATNYHLSLFKKGSSSGTVSFLRESPPCQKPVRRFERRHHVRCAKIVAGRYRLYEHPRVSSISSLRSELRHVFASRKVWEMPVAVTGERVREK